MKRVVSSLLFVLIISSLTFGQVQQTQSLNTTSNEFDPVSLNYSPPSTGVETEVTGIRLYVKFFLDDKVYELAEESNTDVLTLDISVSISNQTAISPFTKTLKISRREPEQMLVYDLGTLISGGGTHTITINSDFHFENNFFTTNHKGQILLDTKLVTDYRTGTTLTSGGKEILNTRRATPPSTTGELSRTVNFSWGVVNPYPAFQLQVVKLYNTDPSLNEEREISADVDWSKALTFELYNQGNEVGTKSIGINMIEGTGYYAWRVRPLGNFGKGLTTDPRNLGAWTPCPDNLQLTGSQTNSNYSFFYFQDPEEDKNWSYTRVFSEDVNKRKGIIQFANGLNFVQQTQTHLHSSNVTLVTQAVVDYTGRTSINTMPVPISGEDDLKTYKTDFFRTANNQLYTAKDFDTDENFRNPTKNNESNAFSYYDGANGLVPNANQYAFSRVIYYNDGTGRVKEQTGVGAMHHTGTDAGGKTTRFYYTSPTDAELITLFGIEAPSPESVMKITTVDPNGVASVQYKSKDGKLLATAIQERVIDEPVLEEINYEPDYPGHTNTLGETTEFENKLTLSSQDGFVTSKRFVLTHHEPNLKVTYSPPTSFWNNANFGTCVDGKCEYNLRIEIFDLNAPEEEQLYWWYERTVDYDNRNEDFTEIVNKIDATPDRNIIETGIADGEYIIVKTLTPSENNIGQLSAKNMASKVQPVVRLLQYWLRTYVQTELWTLDIFYQKVINITTSIDQNQNVYDDNGQPVIVYPEYEFFKELVEVEEGEVPVINWPPDANFLSAMGITNIVVTEDANQQPAELIINTSCGDPIIIPLTPELPPYKCVDIEEFEGDLETLYTLHFETPYDPNNDQGLLNFEDYMIKKLSYQGDIYADLMGGYQQGEFNRMIFHMLTDKYAKVNYPNVGGPAVETDVPSEDPLRSIDYQYTCEDLWPKWVNVVRIMEDITGNNGEHDVADAFDNENGGNKDPLDNHFNDNFDPPFGGGLFKWAFELILSAKMRDFSDDPSRLANVRIKQNLPYLFLEAAGYKFARIIDPFMASGGLDPMSEIWGGTITFDVPDNNQDNYKVLPEDQEDYDIYIKDREISEDMPFIRNPVFAFKYFYYNSYKQRRWPLFWLYRDYEGWEVCERELNYGLFTKPNDNDCLMSDATLKLYADWDFSDREMFYRCVIYKPEMPEFDEGDPASCSDYDIPTMIDNLNDECRTAIDKRKPEFYNSLKAELKENGYTFGGCEGTKNVITQAFLQEMTVGMIEQLKTNTCNLQYNSSLTYCREEMECDPGFIYIDLSPDDPDKIKWMYSVMYGKLKLNYKLPGESCPEAPIHVLEVRNGAVSGN